ncbi:MFS transporter [Sphingobacterium corticibacterium]|uniref:MFS transporter n=1 Tax=Sphingobacterium corticibacterium TaxID=2484746 RepID=A0A4Q6XG17_9SPHI|nr:MFS transporter [Sphingobacterium corticibacterium]RZF58830.1 MFS transporter [Sphingobacterium corticibacterium]
MSTKTNRINVFIPILLSFFVMGMVDIVGVSTNFVRDDFNLGTFAASALPMMVFLWFAVFSIPAGLLMNRYGQKNMVVLSIGISIVALTIPSIYYTFPSMLFAFILLGISNTILQVAINPLASNIVSDDKLAGMLTFGQFTKAIASFLGPILASFAASYYGDWKLALLTYAFISAGTGIYLYFTPIEEKIRHGETSGFGDIIRLLNDRNTLLLFLGILVLVGIDVSMNTFTPQLLIEKLGMETDKAGLSSSLYFGSRIAGSFLGSFLLLRIAPARFLKINMLVAILGVLLLLFTQTNSMIYLGIVIIGFCCANVFSILFTFALQLKQDKQNEISSLMIMGVAGGAIIPPIIGFVTQKTDITFGFSLLLILVLYLLAISFKFAPKNIQ